MCGAKIVKKRLTMRSIAADINEQFLNIDNKFLKTFIHLLTKPDVVINGFIGGTRKKYLNVIQYFAIALTLVGIQVFLMNTFFKDAMELDPDMFNPLAIDPKTQKDNPFNNMKYEDFNNYQSVYYTLSVPFSAISTYFAYWIAGLRQFNFTEHLVFNLYYSGEVIIINAFLIIGLLCVGVDFMTINYISSALIVVYFFYALMRVFKTSWLMTFAQFLLTMLVLGIVFFIVIVLLVIVIALFVIAKKTELF